MLASEPTLLIGCGTGRCGTTSLARLLEGCKDTICTHERRPLLPWSFNETAFQNRVQQLTSDSASRVGDVATSYLPYVDRLIETLPRLKVICIERDRQEVIESYMTKTPWQNHWCEHDGTSWFKDDLWDPMFPKYNGVDKPQAIGMFWDDYYQGIRCLKNRYPANVRIVDIETLNSQSGQTHIFEFLDVPDSHRTYPLEPRYNRNPTKEEAISPAELEQWTYNLRRSTQELSSIVPPGEAYILVDQDTFSSLFAATHRVIPFLEKEGRYWGAPADSQSALAELDRLRQAGADFVVFAWPAFWWLDYYTEFHNVLRTSFPCILQNERLIIFDLRPGQEREKLWQKYKIL